MSFKITHMLFKVIFEAFRVQQIVCAMYKCALTKFLCTSSFWMPHRVLYTNITYLHFLLFPLTLLPSSVKLLCFFFFFLFISIFWPECLDNVYNCSTNASTVMIKFYLLTLFMPSFWTINSVSLNTQMN